MSGGKTILGQSRRAVLKKLGLIGTAGTTAGAGVVLMSKPAFALDTSSLTANDITVSSNNGKIQEVSLTPDLDYSWDGLEDPPDSIGFALEIETENTGGYLHIGGDSGAEETYTFTSPTEREGSGQYVFQNAVSTIQSGPLTKGDFNSANGNGTSSTTSMSVRVTATLTTPNGAYTDSEEATFSVTINNENVEFGSDTDGDGNGGGVGGQVTVTGSGQDRSNTGNGNGGS